MKCFYPFFLFVFSTFTLKAQSSADFDSSFNGNGKVVYPTPTWGLVYNYHLLQLQPDGKIVYCATKYVAGNFQAMIGRLNANGLPDTSFANHGIFYYPTTAVNSEAVSLQLQNNGKIVVIGNEGNASFVLRLKNNGTIDSTFGTNGFTLVNVSPFWQNQVSEIKNANNGSFVISGVYVTDVTGYAFVFKIKSNGTVDSSFAINGIFLYQYNFSETKFYALAVLPDQSIICAGKTASEDALIIKLDSTGALFNGFGNSGIFVKDLFFDWDYLYALQILPGGEILASGGSYNALNNYKEGGVVLKLTASGNLSSGFGNNGMVFYNTPGTDNSFSTMAVQPNGKIVLGGYYYNDTTSKYEAMVVRLLTDGTLDTSFNHSKPNLYIKWLTQYSNISSVIIQPDAKILLYGLTSSTVTNQLAFARLKGGETGSILPLELLEFTAKKSNNKVVLKWVTANQLNLDYFIVEKGQTRLAFKEVGKRNAQNSSLKGNYSFQDNIESKISFYRLKMDDKDGTYKYSPIVSVNNQAIVTQIYPNITTNGITIQSANNEVFRLYNSAGQYLRRLTIGYNSMNTEKPGIYFVKTSNNIFKICKQ